MMRIPLLKDFWFYPLSFAVWFMAMLIMHGNFEYYPRPKISDMSYAELGSIMRTDNVITSNIAELHNALKQESRLEQKGHILHNIGVAFYDYYKISKELNKLDSARVYFEKSIEVNPQVARFYYNLGRCFMESDNMQLAAGYYKKAIDIDPSHIFALHNLGLINYFELRNLAQAKNYLQKALAINPMLPITNYVLGEIALEEKDLEKALYYYNMEANSFENAEAMMRSGQLPLNLESIEYAASMTFYRMAILYSTRFINQQLAQASLHRYLALEKNPQRKSEIIETMKKYWQMQ